MPDLPGWADMPDPDRGVALAHLHARQVYGHQRAEREFPARYRVHPALVALSPMQACDHARGFAARVRTLGDGEWLRLNDLVEARPGNPNPQFPHPNRTRGNP